MVLLSGLNAVGVEVTFEVFLVDEAHGDVIDLLEGSLLIESFLGIQLLLEILGCAMELYLVK